MASDSPDATTPAVSNDVSKEVRELLAERVRPARRHTGPVQIGEVLLIDDMVTGFDDNKPQRPCMVMRVVGPPRAGAWVVPRSTQGRQGTFVAAGALPGLNKDGRFMFLPHFAAAADLADCRSLGVLDAVDLDRVMANVNDVVIDLELDQ